MKYFFDLGDRYASSSNWKDYALVKFCLCAMGIMIGISIPKGWKENVFAAAAGVFVATYIPLMTKLLRLMKTEAE